MKLPPYSPVHGNCPKCRQNSSWATSKEAIYDAINYDTTIYNLTIMCGHCRFSYEALRPCQPKICVVNCQCNTCWENSHER